MFSNTTFFNVGPYAIVQRHMKPTTYIWQEHILILIKEDIPGKTISEFLLPKGT